MLREITLLTNPASGDGRAVPAARAAARHLREADIAVTELTGGGPEETLELARRAVSTGTDALVTCGGDGIAHLAVHAVAGTSTPFGIVPTGTGNDFARMLGIPLDDPVAAARIAAAGAVRPIDLGRVGERWFGTVLAGGFDAKVSDRTNRMRWPRGKLRYNLAVLVELGALRPRDYVLELDGRRERVRAVLVAVGNGTSYGGGMRICPSAQADDGLLDVTVIGTVPRGRLLRLLPTVYSGSHISYPEVRTSRARTVRLSTPDVTAYADGEPFAPLPLTAECVPRAALALAPPRFTDQ